MVNATLWIVFRNNHQHLFPIGRTRKKMKYPAKCQVIIGYIRMAEEVSVFRPGICRMIVWQLKGDQLRHRLLPLHWGSLPSSSDAHEWKHRCHNKNYR